MKKNLYFKKAIKATLTGFLTLAAFISLNAQVYTDTAGLVADLEAGIFEEYILAPANETDTFFLSEQVEISTDMTIRAQDGLGFKPILTGNATDDPSYLFRILDVDVGAEIRMEGIKVTGTQAVTGAKLISNGTFRIITENIDLFIKDCEFVDIQGYNAIAKIYNSGGDITIDNTLVYNSGGKIIQVNYKSDNDDINYVPIIGDMTITNSSFITNYKRIFFELGAGNVPIDDQGNTQRFNAGAENVSIDHCTFYDHQGVDVMQGRSFYDFIPGQAAVKNTMSITNTLFSDMDENLDADSAATTVFDYNYIGGFGVAIPAEELEDFSKYNPTNTVEVAPIFADTASGAWDLTLQNEADLMGSDARPIGDPRWWKESYPGVSVKQIEADESLANIFAYRNIAVVETKNLDRGSISVYNITGSLIHSVEIESARTEMQLPQGLYIIKVDTESGSIARKVVTQ